MADPITSSNVSVGSSGQQPSVYQGGRDVNARAKVSAQGDSTANERALARLNQVLNSGEPLSQDVPRGYYLDIVV